MAGLNPHGKQAPPANDVLLFPFMGMGRGEHVLLRIHEFLAILRFPGEVDQHKTVAAPVAQSEIGHVPFRVGRQSPAMGCEAIPSGSSGKVVGKISWCEQIVG